MSDQTSQGLWQLSIDLPSERGANRQVTDELLNQLGAYGWQSEAGGGKTFCLSAFLKVVRLGRFSTCRSMPPSASILYATFYATFYATKKSELLRR